MTIGTVRKANLIELEGIIKNDGSQLDQKIDQLNNFFKQKIYQPQSVEPTSYHDLDYIKSVTGILIEFTTRQFDSKDSQAKKSRTSLFRHILLHKIIKIAQKNINEDENPYKASFLSSKISSLCQTPEISLGDLLTISISIISFYRQYSAELSGTGVELLQVINEFIEEMLAEKKISPTIIKQLAKLNVQSYFHLHNSLQPPAFNLIPIPKDTVSVTKLAEEIENWDDFLNLYFETDSILWKKIKDAEASIRANNLEKSELDEIVKHLQELQDLQVFLEDNYKKIGKSEDIAPLKKLAIDKQQLEIFSNRTKYYTVIVNGFIRTRSGWSAESKNLFDVLIPPDETIITFFAHPLLYLLNLLSNLFFTNRDKYDKQVERNTKAETRLNEYQTKMGTIAIAPENENVHTKLIKEYATAANFSVKPSRFTTDADLLAVKKKKNFEHTKARRTVLLHEFKLELQKILGSDPANSLYFGVNSKVNEIRDISSLISLALQLISKIHEKERHTLSISDENLVALCYQIVSSDSSHYEWLSGYIKKADDHFQKLFSELKEAESDTALWQRKKVSIERKLSSLILRYKKLKAAQTSVRFRNFDINDKFQTRLTQLDRLIQKMTLALKLEVYREERTHETKYKLIDRIRPIPEAPDTKHNRLVTADTVKAKLLEATSPSDYSQLLKTVDTSVKDIQDKYSRFRNLLIEINDTILQILNNKIATTHNLEKKQRYIALLKESEDIFHEHGTGVFAALKGKNSRAYQEQRTTLNQDANGAILLQKLINMLSRIADPYFSNRYTLEVRKEYDPIKEFVDHLDTYKTHFDEGTLSKFILKTFNDAKALYQRTQDHQIKHNLLNFIKALGARYVSLPTSPKGFIHFNREERLKVLRAIENFTLPNPRIRVAQQHARAASFVDDVSIFEFCQFLATQLDRSISAKFIHASAEFTTKPTLFQALNTAAGNYFGMPLAAIFDAARFLDLQGQLNEARNVADIVGHLDHSSQLARKIAQMISVMYWYQLKKIIDPLSYPIFAFCFMERTISYLSGSKCSVIDLIPQFFQAIRKADTTHGLPLGFGRKSVALQNGESVKVWELIVKCPVLVKKNDSFTVYRNRNPLLTRLDFGPIIVPVEPHNFVRVTEAEEDTMFQGRENRAKYLEEYKEAEKEIEEFKGHIHEVRARLEL